MTETFDPVRKRQFWLDFALPYETEFVPDEIPPQGQPLYVSVATNCLVTGFLLGLADEVRPTLEAIVAWMERRPEPTRGLFNGPRDFWHDDAYALYAWRRTLGLATWLSGKDGAEKHFAAALRAESDCWHKATPAQLKADASLRRDRLGEHMVLALAARQPTIGLTFYSEARAGNFKDLPYLQMLGLYASSRMLAGDAVTQAFVDETRPFLDAGLWPDCLSDGRYTEPALWMKVLFHDSGLTGSPEQAIARLYDFMPDAAPRLHKPKRSPT